MSPIPVNVPMIPRPAVTILVPLAEMTPGQVGAIRNAIIDRLVADVAAELNVSPRDLVVRDPRPFNDLQMYAGSTTDSVVNEWLYDATTTTANAYTSVTGNKVMADQRWVALFGVRDLRRGQGMHSTAMDSQATAMVLAAALDQLPNMVSFIKLSVGGGDKAIWDISCLEAYGPESMVGFTPGAVVIPQNATYNLAYYFKSTVAGFRAYLQLIGVVVEPRGKVISP